MQITINDMMLQGLAAGSIAAFLLVQNGGEPPTTASAAIVCAGDCITPKLDGPTAASTMFVRDAAGIGVLTESRTTLALTAPLQPVAQPDPAELPQRLKHETGLPIEVLAKAVGVSKVSYHKWLNGAGISAESRERLGELLDTLNVLAAIKPNLRQFLDRQTAAGTPLELLIQRKDAVVIGLALQVAVTYSAGGASAPRSGLRRVRSLGWARTLDRERLEDLSPSASADEAADAPDEGEPSAVGYGLFQA
ncbi:MAG: hypothetical protein ACLPYS_04300 [Vulcanimicrobiaceae bacterium]